MRGLIYRGVDRVYRDLVIHDDLSHFHRDVGRRVRGYIEPKAIYYFQAHGGGNVSSQNGSRDQWQPVEAVGYPHHFPGDVGGCALVFIAAAGWFSAAVDKKVNAEFTGDAGGVAPNAPQILLEKAPDRGAGRCVRINGVTGGRVEAVEGKEGGVGVV